MSVVLFPLYVYMHIPDLFICWKRKAAFLLQTIGQLMQIPWTLDTTTVFFFSKTLSLKWICYCTAYLMSRLICKKSLVFLIEHMFWIFVGIAGIQTNIQTYVAIKYPIDRTPSCVICDNLLPHKRRFRESQTVIIRNFVFVSSVGVKRIVCM